MNKKKFLRKAHFCFKRAVWCANSNSELSIGYYLAMRKALIDLIENYGVDITVLFLLDKMVIIRRFINDKLNGLYYGSYSEYETELLSEEKGHLEGGLYEWC